MVDHDPRYPSYDPDTDPYADRLADRSMASYLTEQSVHANYREQSVPLFLSDYVDEPHPSEFMPLPKRRRSYFTSRILAGALACASAGILAALFSSDAARDFVVSAKASSSAVLSAASATMYPNPPQPKAREVLIKDPARLSGPESPAPRPKTVAVAAVTPTAEDIKSAYQSALQGSASQPAAIPARAISTDAIHQLDPNEVASMFKRAEALITSGDLAAARLVLRRAAEAGDARAAMMLAGTYDPTVLEKLGVRGVVPDLAMARSWYEKARQSGASGAASQLELLASGQH